MTFFGNVQTQSLHDQICGYRKSQLRGYMTSFLATAKSPLRGYIASFWGTEVTTQRLHNILDTEKSPLRGYIDRFVGTESHH